MVGFDGSSRAVGVTTPSLVRGTLRMASWCSLRNKPVQSPTRMLKHQNQGHPVAQTPSCLQQRAASCPCASALQGVIAVKHQPNSLSAQGQEAVPLHGSLAQLCRRRLAYGLALIM